MNDNKSFPFGSISPFAALRSQALNICRGPERIVTENFDGWQLMSLEVKTGRIDRIESRSVYANLNNESQHIGFLRAAYWDGVTIRQEFQKQRQDYKLLLPLRVVELPTEQVKRWLAAFDTVNVPIKEPESTYDKLDIKRLRIDQGWVYQVFEMIWQNQSIQYNELNQKWTQVWTQMTEKLQVSPSIIDFLEMLPHTSLDFKYDLQNYDPNKLVLK